MTDAILPQQVVDLARRVVEENKAAGRRIALAESCTGGLVAAAITEIAGSSAVLDRGFVTYSNEAKRDALGVSEDILDAFGAVSVACVYAMAQGFSRSALNPTSISATISVSLSERTRVATTQGRNSG